MSYHSRLRIGLAVPAMLLSQAAWADVTSAQVWGDWKQYLEGMGYQISGTEAVSGDNLTVSDISVAMDMPEQGGAFTMTLGTVTFTQNGGAVDVMMPDVMPMIINATPTDPEEKPVKMTFDYTQTGHAMTASGSPAEMTYDYNAATAGLILQQLQIGDDTFGEENAKVNVAVTGLTSKTTVTIGEMREYQQSGQIEALEYDIAIDNPEEPNKVKLKGGMNGIAFDGGGAIPLVVPDASDMAAMLAEGFAVTGSFTFGSGQNQIEASDPVDGNFAATTSSQGGSLTVKMDKDALSYSGEQNGVQVNAQVPDLPFPVEFSMGKGAFNLAMPLAKAETPQDFAFGITLGDFTMSDMIWSIFDPSGQLPREPATVALDLSGKAKMLVDLMNPEAAVGAVAPGEIHALTVDKVLVDAVGAKLEGSGDFTFDNADKTTFPGMPKPVGAVNVSLVGGNGLMDKLVAMGLLPEEQAMGARMMMGLFAVPGDAPDTLNSKVEFTPDGQVLANGQRIK